MCSQGYEDVNEKAEQLVPCLTKLKDSFVDVVDGVDPKERWRREELFR